jgi:acyl-coenzyme A synthetase/AMP-(fatty) acid ligase
LPDSLISRLYRSGEQNPASPAIVFERNVVTHGQLRGLVNACARQVHGLGVRRGDIVAITMSQSPLHCISLLALARLGAVSIPLFPSWNRPDQAAMIRKFGVSRILSDRAVETFPGVSMHSLKAITASANEPDFTADGFFPDGDTPLSIALTSGTTGVPKGLLRTHAYLLSRVDACMMQMGPGTRMIPPDLHQNIAQIHAIGAICKGGALVFPGSYQLKDMIAAIGFFGVSHLILSPAKAAEMLELLPERAGAFPSLTYLRLVGGRPSESLLESMRTRMSRHITLPYATTEVGVLAYATSDMLETNPDSTGRPVPWVRIEIVDAEGNVQPAGQRGEIRVASQLSAGGYYGETSEAGGKFRGEWFYPGDFGHFDEAGFLYIDGRSDNVVNVGGHKVTMEYIEGVLERHPSVQEAYVFAIEGKKETPDLVAAIKPEAGFDTTGLEAWCRGALGVLTPQAFVVVGDIPRTDTGKTKRQELLAQVLAQRKTGKAG